MGDTFASVDQILAAIGEDTKDWAKAGVVRPWFRGQKKESYLLLPSVLRSGNDYNEFSFTTLFRLMAPGFADTPETDRIDQWLFMMQHLQLPTRLLDWTESPLIALFFATIGALDLKNEPSENAVLYAMDPISLNQESGFDFFPNTWVQSSVLQTIKFAFGTQDEPVDGKRMLYLELPVAVIPSTIHSRIRSQKGCFTLHGHDKRDIESIFQSRKLIVEGKLCKYSIAKDSIRDVFRHLNSLGITYSSLYPELQGLALDLKYRFQSRDC